MKNLTLSIICLSLFLSDILIKQIGIYRDYTKLTDEGDDI